MCYVIVTGRSLLWTLMSLGAALAILSALVTPRWLVGPQITKMTENGTERYTPTVGVFNRCTRLYGKSHCGNFNADGLATPSSVFPNCWKATLFFLALGMAVMTVTVIAALLGCCVQSIGKKSIFDLAGVAQSIAGITYLLGMTLYAGGWGSERVQRLCGEEAAPFYLGDCTLGWAFYSAVLGVLLTFVSAVLSGQAEKSTASDKVQDEMNEGKTLICLA
ncbi:LHFPL tetraspan subfamily member 2 protein [Athalia rosae]|uniref:LHFPL tetraspan subfamily member 2 protein n=1 Tax=Athalia rosae TaxID=37344 RepID=UPI0006263649|nr:LHFPL tetraspan subfamily member 2 protein [Athalia rosae]XP_048516248.1 LHFPL tetraspan subfamily member 2 protein [Athalia rosae]